MKRLIELLRRFSRSLRGQLLLSTAAPVTLLLMVLTVVSVFSFTRLTQTLVEQRDSELVRLAAQQIADNWADSVLLLTQVAATEVVRSGDITATEQLVTGNVALLGRFDRISMTDSDGVVIVTVGGQLGENVSGRDYFDRARRLRRAVRSELYEDEAGSRLIAVAVPVYDLLGQFSGCMLGIWDLAGDTLGAPVASVQVGEGGYAYLVDENGVILYHPDAALIGTDASRHPAVAAVMAGETGARALSVSGGTTMVGYAPIPIHGLSSSLFGDQTWEGWGLLTSEMWEDIVAPLSPYVRFMAAMLTLLVALPLVVLTLSSARIAAPLQSLVTQVDRVASGEFDTTISIEATSSELRELELAFSKMVDQLRRYSDDIQNYVVSILNSQEEERKRVARELHDDTAQALVVLGRRIEQAAEMTDAPELTAQLDALRNMVDDTLQGVRRFTRDLRPPLLEELGLPRTLEILGSRIEREEALAVDVQVVGEPRQLLPELELGLYRLTQEGLSNVRRHARATRAQVVLRYGGDAVELEISDDGVGFDAPSDPGELMRSGRLGLMGIHERARLFGGRAVITSELGVGTVVRVVIPLSSIVTGGHREETTK